jgi:U4/U6.U5 tri-snRNP-associated protein 2
MDLMSKFDGKTVIDGVGGKGVREKKQYNVKDMPTYLVLNLRRFTKTKFGVEKNPTIVTFPVEGVDFKGFVAGGESSSEEDVDAMKVKELKAALASMGRTIKGSVEKSFLVKMVKEGRARMHKYDLVSSIAHDTPTNVGKETASDPIEEGTHRVMARHEASRQWFEVRGQDVNSVMPQMVAVSEAVVLVFKKQG